MKAIMMKKAACSSVSLLMALGISTGQITPLFAAPAETSVSVQAEEQSEVTPVAYFSFDEGEGTTIADNTGNYSATLTGNTTFAEGIDGSAMQVDGTGGALIGQGDLGDNWTVSMWIKGQPGPGTNTVLLAGTQGELKYDQWKKTGKMGVSKFKVKDASFNYNPPQNEWFHATFVGNSSGTTLYINGESKGTISVAIKCPFQTLGYNADTTGFFVGSIDEFKVFDTGLNAEQAAALYDEYQSITKDALAPVIAQCEGLNEEDYTPESWSALSEALAQANALMAQDTPSSKQIRQAIENLHNAVDGLILYTAEDHIRIVTFNIAANKNPDLKAINEQIRRYGATIAGIQEVDVNTSRTKKDMLAELASYGTYPYTFFHKTIDFGGGQYGIGTISSVEILEQSEGDLYSEGIGEPRGWQRSVIEKDGHRLALYNTHLTHEKLDVRTRQMQELLEVVRNDPTEYKAITGDFNTGTGLAEWTPILKEFHAANGNDGNWYSSFNGPADQNEHKVIDNIVVTRNVRIHDTHLVENNLSDHFMFTADFEFLAEEETSLDYVKYLLSTIDELNEEDYGVRSWQALMAEADKARALTKENSQEEADAAAAALEQAKANLKTPDEEPAEDTTRIKGLLKGAILYAQTIVESDDFTRLAPAVQNLIQTSYEEAKSVYDKASASYDECAKAWKKLSDAVHYAEFFADKSDLKARIDQAQALDLSGYSEESVLALQQAIEAAKAVYDDENALQERIDQALANLNAAIANLDVNPDTVDKTMLRLVIAEASKAQANSEAYIHNDAWNLMLAKLEAARTVEANAAATAQEVQSAAEELHAAYLNIRLAPDEELVKALQDFISLSNSISRSLYSQSDLSRIDAAANLCAELLAGENFDNDAARKAVEETLPALQALIEKTEADAKAAPAADTPNLTEPAPSVQSVQSASVTTAAATKSGFWMLSAAGAAALGWIASRRRRK